MKLSLMAVWVGDMADCIFHFWGEGGRSVMAFFAPDPSPKHLQPTDPASRKSLALSKTKYSP